MKANPFQTLPETVEIGGETVSINSDFRVGVAIENEMTGEKPDGVGLLLLFYNGKMPKDLHAAVNEMIRFYAHSEEQKLSCSGGGKGRWYDFEQDADALHASFLSAYNIDLSKAKLHWWTFRRLMLNLPPDTPFMQRVRYRTADLKKLGKEERKHYKKMRALYAIKNREAPRMTAEERDAALREKIRKRYEDAQKGVNHAG